MNEDAARVKMYGTFDQYGRALGFYPDDIYLPHEDGSRNAKIPADAVEITLEQWQELLAKQPFAAYVDGEVNILARRCRPRWSRWSPRSLVRSIRSRKRWPTSRRGSPLWKRRPVEEALQRD